MPYTSAMKRVVGGTTLHNINVQIGDGRQIQAAQQQIVSLLRQRHNIRAGRDDDFTVRNQQEIADAATATTAVMTVLLGSIAGVSLVVGGIGIMNIMLVSVTERTREIGTRMAVGAHGSDILMQFLIEAVTLSSVGGVIGIIFGIGASKIFIELRALADADFAQLNYRGFHVQRRRRDFLWLLSGAQSGCARPDRSASLRIGKS
jgi:putative ABC transport system permease protein